MDRDIHFGRGWFSIDAAPSSSLEPYLPDLANKKATSRQKNQTIKRIQSAYIEFDLKKHITHQCIILTINIGDKVDGSKIQNYFDNIR